MPIPTHLIEGNFPKAFPPDLDNFPTPINEEHYIDAWIINSAFSSLLEIETYVLGYMAYTAAPIGDDVLGDDGSLLISIPPGLYAAYKYAMAWDSELLAENIKDGVDIFGVIGSHAPLLGVDIEGAEGALIIDIPEGNYPAGKHATAQDADLLAENIKAGISIFGVLGSLISFWSDADFDYAERRPAGDVNANWRTVASDSDGSNLIAAAYAGRLWTSADGGANWTERRPAGDVNANWYAVASDSDGSNLIAGVYGGRLWTSADGGANWTERRPAGDVNANWRTVASDSDGSNLIACASTGRLWTSVDGGANWTERRPAGDVNASWRGVASDSDGSNLIACGSTGRLWTSADGGANWTERRPTGDVNASWYGVASNADGSFLIAYIYGGSIWTSADGGANWTIRRPGGDLNSNWYSVVSDDDSSHLFGGIYPGRLYTLIQN